MVDQIYGAAWLTSMVKVRCQDHEPELGLGLGFWKAAGLGSSSDVGASVKLHYHVEEIPGCI